MKRTSKTWILRDYCHITMSVILVGDDILSCPIDQESQWTIDHLEELTDLHFIFTQGVIKKVDPVKFSELYQASSYSVTSDPTGISGILDIIEYDREILKDPHLYFFITRTQVLHGFQVEDIKKIIDCTQVLTRSIFKIQRQRPEILRSIYEKPQQVSWFSSGVDRTGTYSTHTSKDPVLVLKSGLLEKISEFLTDKPGYLETFTDYRDFFASIIMRLGQDLVLNKNIQDVKISTTGT